MGSHRDAMWTLWQRWHSEEGGHIFNSRHQRFLSLRPVVAISLPPPTEDSCSSSRIGQPHKRCTDLVADAAAAHDVY